MKLEVRCPSCQKGYLVEESLLDQVIPCPGCSDPIPLEPERIASPPRVEGRTEGAPRPVARPTPIAGAVSVEAVAAAAPPEVTEEIVCPRCQLHFSPRRIETRPRQKDRPTVLVVEDMSYFREVAADALSGQYEVKLAGTLDGARSIMASGCIDLLILDLTLDGGDHGFDLLRELSYKPCPILIYTAQDESEIYGDSWEELQRLGADDIVLKGMNVGELLVRKVGALLGRSWDDET